jgi:hypothetical protein
MKNFQIKNIAVIFLVICLTLLYASTNCLKIKNTLMQEGGKNAPKVPIINVHMEEPDRDPLEVKRIEQERRIERNRLTDLEMMEEQDKRSFQQIISVQNNQIEMLSRLEDKTGEILDSLMGKK